MATDWQPKPGDRIFRPRRIKRFRLRRVLGVPALFSTGYGNVGSSIYYALGIVAVVAMGATPIAMGIAGVLFIFTALTYAEGTAMLPEAGGSASFARQGFNDAVGFIVYCIYRQKTHLPLTHVPQGPAARVRERATRTP